MPYRPRELVVRAREAAARLLATLDHNEMVPRFLDMYAAENRRPGRADQPAHYRDQLETIRVALADLPIVRRWLADPGRIEPHSREAADHSLHFLIAIALLDGAFGLRQFDNERWTDAKVRALMAQLEFTTDVDLARRAGEAYPCALHATGRDGGRYDVEILQPPGFSPNGLDTQTVLDKFAAVTERHLVPDAQNRLVDAVMALDKAISCDGLMQLLATKRTVL